VISFASARFPSRIGGAATAFKTRQQSSYVLRVGAFMPQRTSKYFPRRPQLTTVSLEDPLISHEFYQPCSHIGSHDFKH